MSQSSYLGVTCKEVADIIIIDNTAINVIIPQ